MKKNKVSWMIGGPAGYGILNAGMAFAKSLSRGGLYVFTTNKYPSLIRGGHNALFIRASDKELTSHTHDLDLVVALNKETIDLHQNDVIENGGIVYDGDSIKDVKVKKGVKLFSVPLLKLAKEAGAEIMRNTVALGACMALMDYDIKMLEGVLTSIFSRKGKEVVENNKKAANAGYNHIKQNYEGQVVCQMSKVAKAPKRMILNCNDAISMGALQAGLKLFAAYPMTPASSILHFMAKYERDMEIVVKHTEDELASMNTIIGGGFAGARSMTSTSGGGFSLMSEAFGLAGMTETPCVVVNAQRGGPSTGLPTRQEQADLLFMVNASQGEFPRVIMAPGDVEEAFYETANVFNLTDKYQTPGIILTDKYNYASNKSIPFFDLKKVKIDRGQLMAEADAKKQKDYKRFKFTKSGISPRALPGYPNTIFRATGNEHSEYGDITEDPVNRKNMVEKRLSKLEGLRKDIKTPVKLHGPKQADLTLVAWGSTKGPILEAMSLTDKKVNFLQILYPWPFPKKEVEDVLKKAKKVLLIEGNATAQMGELIRQQTGFLIENKFLKYNGHQFYPIEIKDKIEEVIK